MDAVTRAKVDDLIFGRLRMEIVPAKRRVFDEAIEWAGHLLGAPASKWDLLESLCEELLSDHRERNVVLLSERRRRSADEAKLDAIAAALAELDSRLVPTPPKMCAPPHPGVMAPRRLHALLAQAFDAARTDARRYLSPGECLVRIAAHFLQGRQPPPCAQGPPRPPLH